MHHILVASLEQTEELEARHIYEKLGGLQLECIFLGSINTILGTVFCFSR